MANRTFNPTRALEKELIHIPIIIPLSAGAVVGTVRGRGVTSVTKSGTGEYTIVLQDAYQQTMRMDAQICSLGNTMIVSAQPKSHVASTKTFVVNTINGSFAPTDTNAACELHVKLELRNSSVS